MAQSYSGTLPYIFVSYSHKDADRVLPAIEAMQQKGYRVWYDRGIEAGTEWSNNIAAHLHSCAVFVAFISPNSMASENCLDEIAYAKSHQKPSLMIFLEEHVVLPQGTEMQTARFQRMYFNRQTSVEAFVDNLSSTPIFDPCIDAASAEPSPAPAPTPTPAQAPAPAAPKATKLPLIIGCAVAAVAILVLCIVLFAGGSQNDPSDSSQDPATTTKAPAAVQMSDDPNDYTFTLEGVVYQIPFAFSQLTDNGWTISSSDVNSGTKIAGMSKESLYMVKDGKKIYVSVYNDSGNLLTVSECKIGMIEVEVSSGTDFSIAKGLTPSATPDEVIAAFGTPNIHETKSDYILLFYGEEQYSYTGMTFYCYTEENNMQKYSSIQLTNYVDETETETNEAVPDYLSQYKAPTALGTDPLSGIIRIEDELYRFPCPLQAFLDNGWVISSRPAFVIAGSKESVSLARDGQKLSLDLCNFAEYQTTPENSAVISVSLYPSSKVTAELPAGITLGMPLADLEKIVPAAMERSDGTYSTSFRFSESDTREFSLTLTVDNETGNMDDIFLRCQTWDYE